MNEPPDQVHASIGKAVLAAQYFEQWMVTAYYQLRLIAEQDFKLSEEQLSDHRVFRVPTKNLLKALSEKSQISSDFENRINSLLEQRHIIVHRWFLINGYPSAQTEEKWRELGLLAEFVSREANELSFLLLTALRNCLGQNIAGAPRDELERELLRAFQSR